MEVKGVCSRKAASKISTAETRAWATRYDFKSSEIVSVSSAMMGGGTSTLVTRFQPFQLPELGSHLRRQLTLFLLFHPLSWSILVRGFLVSICCCCCCPYLAKFPPCLRGIRRCRAANDIGRRAATTATIFVANDEFWWFKFRRVRTSRRRVARRREPSRSLLSNSASPIWGSGTISASSSAGCSLPGYAAGRCRCSRARGRLLSSALARLFLCNERVNPLFQILSCVSFSTKSTVMGAYAMQEEGGWRIPTTWLGTFPGRPPVLRGTGRRVSVYTNGITNKNNNCRSEQGKEEREGENM